MTSVSAKDSDTFLPLEIEHSLFLIQRILFGFSCLLHIPAVFCLLKETPPHQAEIKSVLVILQIFVIISDIYDTVLFEPVPVFDAFAGYCKAICYVVPPTVALGLYVFTIAGIGISSLSCILLRHQAMMPFSNRLKFRKRTHYMVIIVITLIFVVPTMTFTLHPFDREESEKLIDESHYDISWIRERGSYFAVRHTTFIYAIVWVAITCFIGFFVVSMSLFLHMFFVLRDETNKSERSKLLIRHSLRRLFVQLNVPFLFVVVPLLIVFIQIAFRCFPFSEICVSTLQYLSYQNRFEQLLIKVFETKMVAVIAVFTVPLHPIVHNLVLLFIMPTYRRAIAGALRKIRYRQHKNASQLFTTQTHPTAIHPST